MASSNGTNNTEHTRTNEESIPNALSSGTSSYGVTEPGSRPYGVRNGEREEEETDSDEPTEVPRSPSPPVESDLDRVFNEATKDRLRETLRDICAKHPQARELASEALLMPMQGPSSRKRKAYESCVNCKVEFRVSENRMGVCRYHPGEIEVDHESETWDDHDDDCHGDKESILEGEEFEDGYIMSCCEKRPYEKGCKISRHSTQSKEKKSRTTYRFS